MPKIFISYRRVDSEERTHRISDWLTLKYGKRNVFVDVDRLGVGVSFKDELRISLDQSNVLLVIIGDKWVEELKRRAPDRAEDKDYVYLEVKQGLDKEIPLIIPVMIDKTPGIRPTDLPPELVKLTTYNYARVRSNPDFHKDMDEIRAKIDGQFWYERALRLAAITFSILAIFVMVLLAGFGANQLYSDITATDISTPTIEGRDVGLVASPSETLSSVQILDTAVAITDSAVTEVALAATQAALVDARRTEQADNATATEVVINMTVNAVLSQTAEALFTDTPTPTETATSTPSSTPTTTPDASRTASAQETLAVIAASETQEFIAQQATQDAQATENAPTNTPRPTFTVPPTLTNTPTPPPTATLTPTQEASATATIDQAGTQQAARLTQNAVATQVVATSRAEIRATQRASIQESIRISRISYDISSPANIRSAPDASSERILQLTQGTVVIVVGETEDGQWYELQLPDGETGWIFAELVQNPQTYTDFNTAFFEDMINNIVNDTAWEPITEEFDGVAMVLVPPWCFDFGATNRLIRVIEEMGAVENNYDDEIPASFICVKQPYWIDQFEVSQEQFERLGGTIDSDFLDGDNLPVTDILWEEAKDYCELRGGYLPSEVQWEYAARGPQSFIFPWGDTFDFGTRHNWNSNDNPDAVEPVDSYPQGTSWVGAYQMQGNVIEWTLSALYAYPSPTSNWIFFNDFNDLDENGDPVTNRPIPVGRGSSYLDGLEINARNTNRIPATYRERRDDFGVRCVRDF